MPQVAITVEVEEKTITICQGSRSCMFKLTDTDLIVDHIAKLSEGAPQAVPTPEGTQATTESPVPFAGAGVEGEDLLDALTGVMADPRIQSGVKTVWGFLQTLKTTPPVEPPAKAGTDD